MKDLTERIAALSPEQRALFAARLKERGLSTPRPQIIPRRKQHNYSRLSFDQERIWIVDQLEPGNPAYNIFSVSYLHGHLDTSLMERAFNEVVRRHEVLRTTFTAIDGEPRQVITPSLFIPVELIDLRAMPADEREREVTSLLNEATSRPFDLAGGPLARFGLIRVADDQYALHYTVHHTVIDRWSADIIEKEMTQIYLAFAEGKPSPLPDLPIQYADFAEWQRDWLQGEALEEQVAYWRKRFEGVPQVLELPTDRPRPAMQTFRGARRTIILPRTLLDGLKTLSRQEHATMFMTCLAIFKTLLYRYTGQEDISVGVALANRNRPETLGLIGYFLNMLVMTTNFSANPSFREVLNREKTNATSDFAHGEFPFGRLIQELKPKVDPSRNPLFQVAYIYLDFVMPDDAQEAGFTGEAVLWDNGHARFDMTLALTDMTDSLEVTIEFNTDLFDASTIERTLGHFRCLVEAILADADTRVAHLALLTSAERHQLLAEWNDVSSVYPQQASIHQLFEEQVANTPDAIALFFGEQRFTYLELNKRANRLAHHLKSMGIGPEVPVGLMLERSADLVIAILGILKAGGAYVPLDSTYPLERLDFMLKDARLPVLITEDALLDKLPSFFGQVLCIDSDAELFASASESNPASNVTGENLAYIIYTSGSTGQPKGIIIPHRGVTRLVRNTNYVQVQTSDRVAQASSASFDAITFELWGALLNGAQVVGISKDLALSPVDFAAQIREREITIIFLTTALFNQMAMSEPTAFATVRQVLFGGEAVEPKWVRTILAEGAPKILEHVYGPTESTTYATWYQVREVTEDALTVPIGGPLSNTLVYVLDRHLEPAPIGIPGELFIGGDGLARGYLWRPELTAERFVPNPFSAEPGARLYRTGDLVRFLPEGQIEFLGRVDNQVKVRGFRIELEEIEAVLRTHPKVKETVVLARSDNAGERRLAAYVVCNNDHAPTASEWRTFLASKLPDYMVPAAFVLLDKLPLNSSGKVDRRALPAPDLVRPELEQAFMAPTSALELTLADIWQQVLGIERVGVQDSFFELGGDSLMAIQVVSKAREAGVSISIHQIFQSPTIAGLSQQVNPDESPTQPTKPVPALSLISDEDSLLLPPQIEDAYPLTRLQAGMVFHSEYDPDTAVYHEIFSFHIEALLDLDLLRACFEESMRRHPVLRTSFDLSNYSQPLQLVYKQVELPFEFEDLTLLTEEEELARVDSYIESEKSRGFTWASVPLLRLLIQRRRRGSFQFNLSFHHALLDGWSLSSVLNELFQHYVSMLTTGQAGIGPPPSIQFREFVALEQAAMRSESQRQFWQEKLEGVEPSILPRWHKTRSGKNKRPEILELLVPIPTSLSDGLKGFASTAKLPLKSVVLAAHLRVLALVTGKDEVITGLVSNGRPEEPDGDRIAGLFLNTQPLVFRLPGGTWEDLARSVFDAERELLPFRRFPFLEIQQMGEAGAPFFDAGFNYTHFHIAQGMLHLPGLKILDFRGISETNFPLLVDFDLDLTVGEVQLALKYEKSEFTHDQIEAMSGYYERTFVAIASRSHEQYEDCVLLSEPELHRQLAEWKGTEQPFPRSSSIHELFAEQVSATPDAVALEFESQKLTYAELDERANQLAGYLRANGVGVETVVGIMMERSLDMIVSLLGVLKAGGAYLPLDPDYPPERLEFMLDDASVRTVLTHRNLSACLRQNGVHVISLDEARAEISTLSKENPEISVSADNLAYITYTSGSTGRPKGVQVVHRGVVRLVKGNDYAQLGPDEGCLQFAPLAFDASTFEIWGSLLNGGRLIIMPPGPATLAELGRVVRTNRVTVLWLTAGLFNLMVDEQLDDLRGLRQLLAGGDVLSLAHVERFLRECPDCVLVNGYGPTENTTFTCCHPMKAAAEFNRSVPIGRPIANTQVYLLDRNLRPVATGARGELFTGGDGLARGYLNHADLTAARFVPDPFSVEPGRRLYRTGDWARYLPNGEIEFLGRVDNQAKIRGFRIEPSEIEVVLNRHEAVRDAVVAVSKDEKGEKQLVAFVIAASPADGELNQTQLRQFLKDQLPDYMIPSFFVTLEQFPLTLQGKVDYRALPVPGTDRPQIETPFVAPRTTTEEILAALWSRVLGIKHIGINDHFFELGGNSLSATQLVSQVRQTLEVELPLRDLFHNATVAELALVIEGILAGQMDELSDEEAQRLLQDES
jgi:amino acid adenylation domain-containing protein